MRSDFQESIEQLVSMGYQIAATAGTADYFRQRGITQIKALAKPGEDESSEETVIKWIQTRKVDLVINIPEGTTRRDEVTAGYLMRRAAVDYGASLLTNIK